jgi:alpha-amylase
VGNASWYNTDLYDYSGAHGVTPTHVFADGRVLVKTAPVGHTIAGARGHGYSIWAPKPSGVTFTTVQDMYNYLATYVPTRSTQTVQEWEMADDLGDSNVKSLQQGGKLPSNSTASRTVGRIYTAVTQTITCKVYPEVDGRTLTVSIYNASGSTLLAQTTGVATAASPLIVTHSPASAKWVTIKVKNANSTQLGQKVWVNTSYTAPTTVNTRSSPGNLEPPGEGGGVTAIEAIAPIPASISAYPNPTSGEVYFSAEGVSDREEIHVELFDVNGKQVIDVRGTISRIQDLFNGSFERLGSGIYILRAQSLSLRQQIKLVKL